jgi:hypothetical protein
MTADKKTYERFDAATKGIDAYAITYEDKHVGRVVFKHGSACRCFAQVWGTTMGEGTARGHGFDRLTEAFENAMATISLKEEKDPVAIEHVNAWRRAAADAGNTNKHWDNRLRTAGYVVQHVI